MNCVETVLEIVIRQSTRVLEMLTLRQLLVPYATQGTEVSVVAEDTDILVLLMYHWQKRSQIFTAYRKKDPEKAFEGERHHHQLW